MKPSVQDSLGFCRIKLFIPEVITMKLDFTKKKLLTESWMKTFGEWNKTLLKYMYGKEKIYLNKYLAVKFVSYF